MDVHGGGRGAKITNSILTREVLFVIFPRQNDLFMAEKHWLVSILWSRKFSLARILQVARKSSILKQDCDAPNFRHRIHPPQRPEPQDY